MHAFHLLGPVLPLLALTGTSSSAQAQTADIALAPFIVENDSAGVLRTTADSALELFVAGLKANGLTVARVPHLTEKNLKSVQPVPFALIGTVQKTKEGGRADFRLMEVASGEEMVLYHNDGKRAAIIAMATPVSGRIATFVKERKGIK